MPEGVVPPNIRESEERFRLLVESVRDYAIVMLDTEGRIASWNAGAERVEEYAIYMLDPTGRVLSWNAGAEKIKGFSAQDIIGKNFACFYTAEDVAAGKPQHNLELAARFGHLRDQGRRVRKDGATFYA